MDELFLQANRVRGNHDPLCGGPILSRLGNGQYCRNQIGKTLADASACFGDQVMPGGNSSGDGVRHGELLRPLLVVFQPGRDTARGSQNIVCGQHAIGHRPVRGPYRGSHDSK